MLMSPSVQSWFNPNVLQVLDYTTRKLLIAIPWEFMSDLKEHTNTYVLEQIYNCYQVNSGTLHGEDGRIVDAYCSLNKMKIFFKPHTGQKIIPKVGPYAHVSPTNREQDLSHCYTKKEWEVFRSALIVRDRECIISGWEAEHCEPVHILPFYESRYQFIDALLDGEEIIKDSKELLNPRFGILLVKQLQVMFMNGEVAFYEKGEDFIFHCFNGSSKAKEYHGKVIKKEHFGGSDNLPYAKLLKFHYSQSAMKAFRGFEYHT